MNRIKKLSSIIVIAILPFYNITFAQLKNYSLCDDTEMQMTKCAEINDNIKNQRYYLAKTGLIEIEETCGLSSAGYIELIALLSIQQDYIEAIKVGKQWESKPNLSNEDKQQCYDLLFSAFFLNEDYHNAQIYAEKLASISTDDELTKVMFRLAKCYQKQDNIYMAYITYKKYANMRLKDLNKTEYDVNRHNISDKDLGYAYMYICKYLARNNDDSYMNYLKMAASCGDKQAIQMCNAYNMYY